MIGKGYSYIISNGTYIPLWLTYDELQKEMSNFEKKLLIATPACFGAGGERRFLKKHITDYGKINED